MPNLYYPLVDTRDIGKSAAACLAEGPNKHHEKIYEISGPEILSGPDIARVLVNLFKYCI